MNIVVDEIDQDFLMCHTRILCLSYQYWTSRPLIDCAPDDTDAWRKLYQAPIAVVSHDTQPDPVFNYANSRAQQLFGMTWSEITHLPSHHSAEPVAREERSSLLDRVARHGYVDDYSGVRIAKDGSRFMIRNAVVWNLLNEAGDYCGQAAMISEWIPLC